MKSSSENPAPAAPNKETAMGLMAANMAIPGTGTFLAGHRLIGVLQVALCMTGMAVTLALGTKMVFWMLGNWDRLHDPYADPVETLGEIWRASRWPLAGIAAFAFAWLWAFADSLRIVRRAKRTAETPKA